MSHWRWVWDTLCVALLIGIQQAKQYRLSILNFSFKLTSFSMYMYISAALHRYPGSINCLCVSICLALNVGFCIKSGTKVTISNEPWKQVNNAFSPGMKRLVTEACRWSVSRERLSKKVSAFHQMHCHRSCLQWFMPHPGCVLSHIAWWVLAL